VLPDDIDAQVEERNVASGLRANLAVVRTLNTDIKRWPEPPITSCVSACASMKSARLHKAAVGAPRQRHLILLFSRSNARGV
jgi:hypothetical protein